MPRIAILLLLAAGCAAPPRTAPRPAPPAADARVWTDVGRSVAGRPIRALELGAGPETTLIFGGTANWRAGARRAPESEPETRAVMDLVERLHPAKIVSIHEPLMVNNYDGPGGAALAKAMAVENGYPVKGYIGYPTPGSFGTWAGKERGIAMVTLELGRGKRAFERNLGAIAAAVRF